MIDYEKINPIYYPLIRGIEIFNKSEINAITILGRAAVGKSYMTDYALKELGIEHLVFKGTMSEAKFFEFLQINSDKTIVLRDCGHMIRRIGFLDFIKSATDLCDKRIISRNTYAQHMGVDSEFEFTGKIIFELNELPKRYEEDLKAWLSRGILTEINPSFEDVKNIMHSICQNDSEKETTDFLISKYNVIGLNNMNLRTFKKCLMIREAAERDKLEWQKQIELFLNMEISESRKLLYRFAGLNTCVRMDFVKYLMQTKGWSLSTTQRRINEWIYLGDIYTDGKMKQTLLSLNEIK